MSAVVWMYFMLDLFEWDVRLPENVSGSLSGLLGCAGGFAGSRSCGGVGGVFQPGGSVFGEGVGYAFEHGAGAFKHAAHAAEGAAGKLGGGGLLAVFVEGEADVHGFVVAGEGTAVAAGVGNLYFEAVGLPGEAVGAGGLQFDAAGFGLLDDFTAEVGA